MTSIDTKLIAQLQSQFAKNEKLTTVQRPIIENGILKSTKQPFMSATNQNIFSLELKTSSITDQQHSGRCWLFAALNLLRYEIAKEHKLESFELSQSYPYFWDKLEKANFFYDQVITTKDKPADDRYVDMLFQDPQGDGGWWNMAVNIIEKYGIVPKQVMPDSVTATKSHELNTLLNRKLRKDALALRKADGPKAETLRQDFLGEIYNLLSVSLGTPPEKFDFEYRDKDEKFHQHISLTPQSFYQKFTSHNLGDYVTLVNDPSEAKQFNVMYTIRESNNMTDQPAFTFLNVDMKDLKPLIVKQLQSDIPVWFGCDVQVDTSRKGVMDPGLYRLKEALDIDFAIPKSLRLATRDNSINHAMLFTGVNLIDDKPTRWKVENSWGEKVGDKGFFIMNDAWMDEYVYLAVIKKEYLPAPLKKALEKTPIVLPPWDPAG